MYIYYYYITILLLLLPLCTARGVVCIVKYDFNFRATRPRGMQMWRLDSRGLRARPLQYNVSPYPVIGINLPRYTHITGDPTARGDCSVETTETTSEEV